MVMRVSWGPGDSPGSTERMAGFRVPEAVREL